MSDFMILPSTSSVVGEMSIVIIFFVSFCIYVSYIAAYETGYKPNFVMFLNFIFDDYNGSKNFQRYIQNIVSDSAAESFTNLDNKTVYSGLKNNVKNVISNFTDGFQKLISKSFIKGNKIKINRTI